MLPDSLASSYKRYKQDTALFTTWLANAAKPTGYKPETMEQERQETVSPSKAAKAKHSAPGASAWLKGKARKATKAAAPVAEDKIEPADEENAPLTVRCSITTKELLRQATVVANGPEGSKVQPPQALHSISVRAIRARQRCADWFQKCKADSESVHIGHSHFIQVLQQCSETLQPCLETAVQHDKVATHDRIATHDNHAMSQDSDQLTDRFEVLNVEESPDVDPAEAAEVSSMLNTAQKSKQSKGKADISIYQIRDEEAFDEDQHS